MNAIGIICEYNPFHNGHLYHLNKIKEMYPGNPIVLVMGGSFMQRGEASMINKWDKTRISLENGIDLVVELPFPFATQSADVFARGNIQILEALKVSTLVFGSECNHINHLKKLVDIQLHDVSYNEKVQKLLNSGLSYPTAMSKALEIISSYKVESPNDLLGMSYIKAIYELKSTIEPVSIERTHPHHDLGIEGEFSSGSAIRQGLKDKKPITHAVPSSTLPYLKSPLLIENYFSFLKYKILTEMESLSKYQTVDEGLDTRIRKHIVQSTTLEELIQNVKTKRYTYNKLSRMFTHILCNFTKEEAKSFQNIEYIRILGFSDKGKSYLSQIKEQLNIPLVTNFGDTNSKMLDLEYRVTAVYASILDEKSKKKLIEEEYKNPPIKKTS